MSPQEISHSNCQWSVQSRIQKYETGKHCVSASMLYELARYFAVPAAPFFEGLPVTAVGPLSEAACEIDGHIAYISTTVGRDLLGKCCCFRLTSGSEFCLLWRIGRTTGAKVRNKVTPGSKAGAHYLPGINPRG